jgi:hypothetical protein
MEVWPHALLGAHHGKGRIQQTGLDLQLQRPWVLQHALPQIVAKIRIPPR